jgi:hypothetical protein
MHLFCKKTSGHPELRCGVCGQGFVMSWERQTSVERAVCRTEIQEVMRQQHRSANGQEPHPLTGFEMPGWRNSGLSNVGGSLPNSDL